MAMNGLFPHFLGILSKSPTLGAPPAAAPHPFRPSAPVLKRRPTTAETNASAWNNGGYAQHKLGDAQRESEFPIGTPVNNPAVNRSPLPGARPAPRPPLGGGGTRKLF